MFPLVLELPLGWELFLEGFRWILSCPNHVCFKQFHGLVITEILFNCVVICMRQLYGLSVQCASTLPSSLDKHG